MFYLFVFPEKCYKLLVILVVDTQKVALAFAIDPILFYLSKLINTFYIVTSRFGLGSSALLFYSNLPLHYFVHMLVTILGGEEALSA